MLHNISFVKIIVVGPKNQINTQNKMYHAFERIILYVL
jgi:hypothetical protein